MSESAYWQIANGACVYRLIILEFINLGQMTSDNVIRQSANLVVSNGAIINISLQMNDM